MPHEMDIPPPGSLERKRQVGKQEAYHYLWDVGILVWIHRLRSWRSQGAKSSMNWVGVGDWQSSRQQVNTGYYTRWYLDQADASAHSRLRTNRWPFLWPYGHAKAWTPYLPPLASRALNLLGAGGGGLFQSVLAQSTRGFETALPTAQSAQYPHGAIYLDCNMETARIQIYDI